MSGGSTPTRIALTVYDRVTNGASAMRGDTLAYLSTVTHNYCKNNGRAISSTDRNTSGTYGAAICQTAGDRTTNGEDNSSVDDNNPRLSSSTLWYGVQLPDGTFGYISRVCIDPSQRRGLELPAC